MTYISLSRSFRLYNNNYTVFKKTTPFYFCDNFVGHEPMLIIFSRNVAKEIGNMQRLTWLLLAVQMSYR